MLVNERDKLVGRKWLLSKPEITYVGRYTHAQLGNIDISLNEQNRFDVSWGVLHSGSLGMDTADQIRVELEPNSGSIITFEVDKQVMALRYAGILFHKVQSAL